MRKWFYTFIIAFIALTIVTGIHIYDMIVSPDTGYALALDIGLIVGACILLFFNFLMIIGTFIECK